ncbi:MAG: MATE family efflux transporter [Aminobacteriaceae bacterium]|jgi:putative MATE family efflux protein|nr:MATE family efflux transporter [Synergistaceae bacterium]MDD4020873.1 MATE family efflux transporter [Synergistaceae bacterium]MDD4611878.1 MATE family efflux transporter [Synergistaceae bacterium]
MGNKMARYSSLGEDRISKLVLRFSLPAIGGMLANALYNIVDRIFVGRTVGPSGIGAISVVFPFILLAISYGLLIGVGAGSLISISLGEKRRARAEKAMGNALVFFLGGSIALSLAGASFSGPILEISGGGGTLFPLAKEYMDIVVWGIPFSTAAFGFNFFIRAEGSPRYAMYSLLVGAFANILLDALLILVLDMGIRGAAIATVLSQVLSAAWAAAFYIRKRSILRFRLKHMVPDSKILGRIIAVGLSPFLTELSFTFVMALFNRLLRQYGGDLAISAMGIFFSLDSLLFLPVLGIAEGVQPIIGYNYGAGNGERTIASVKAAIWMGSFFFAGSFLLIVTVPEPLIRIFNADDPQLLSMAVRGIRIAYSGVLFASVSVIASHAFQAIGKARLGIFLTLSRHFLFILLPLYFLPPLLGTDGIWLSIPLSDLGGGIIGAWFLKREFRLIRERDQFGRDSFEVDAGAVNSV